VGYWSDTVTVRGQVAILIYMMVQGVLFGVGVVAMVLIPTWFGHQQLALPVIVVVSFLIAVPLAWFISPHLLNRYEKRRAAREERAAQPRANLP
jgi:uncharacterized membrane protein YdbT with pleckstrin-like domain